MSMAEARVGRKFKDVRSLIDELYDGDLHAKRVDSLAAATLGIMSSASVAVSLIGQALALARGIVVKHAIKQVDRLFSNRGIDVWASFAHWVPHRVSAQKKIVVAMDWTDFDHDGQTTLALNLVTGHGRATPLIWLTVWKEELAERRNAFEDACLARLADRGFGDHKLFAFLQELGFGYVIRFRGNIHVTDAAGEVRAAADWVGKGGRARKLPGARIGAAAQQSVGAVVCVHARGMKEPWCLAASHGEAATAEIVNHYARRWTIEPSFRDTKDLRFGMGLSATRISEPTRRDRLLLVSAFATVLLTSLVLLAKVLVWIACSSPIHPRPAPIPSSARAACFTTSSPPCPSTDSSRSWLVTPSFSARKSHSRDYSGLCENEGMAEPSSARG